MVARGSGHPILRSYITVKHGQLQLEPYLSVPHHGWNDLEADRPTRADSTPLREQRAG